MLSRLRALLAALLFATLGAVAGRLSAELQRQAAAGEEPHLDVSHLRLRPQDVVPGVVAAMRVGDRPWSYLRIPPWFAAFAVNFAVAALARRAGGATVPPQPPDDTPEDAPEDPISAPPEEPASEPQPPPAPETPPSPGPGFDPPGGVRWRPQPPPAGDQERPAPDPASGDGFAPSPR